MENKNGNIIDILEYTGEDYMPLVDFNGWRVAIANYKPEWRFGNIERIDCHFETDEIFVLLQGKVSLFIGKEMKEYKMEHGKVYNVKRGTWHQLCMSEDGKVLIVENADTGSENSTIIKLK